MGSFLFFAFSWWSILLRVVAIVHFIRRRPNFFWIWVILFHWVGALVYILVEVVPDAGLLQGTFQVFPRRRRIQELERIILDNPSAGNYEELGLLYLDDGNFARARAATTRPSLRAATIPIRFIGEASPRSSWETSLPRFPISSARSNPIRATIFTAPKACSLGRMRRRLNPKKPTLVFREAVQISTISETYYHYALFLQSQGRAAEAREWAQKILEKKPTMPLFLRRRERPWFRKASMLLAKLPAG